MLSYFHINTFAELSMVGLDWIPKVLRKEKTFRCYCSVTLQLSERKPHLKKSIHRQGKEGKEVKGSQFLSCPDNFI